MSGTEGQETQPATSQGPTQPLVPPTGYSMTAAQACTYLVDVATSMGEAWIAAGNPNPWSDWVPGNVCTVSAGLYDISEFSFSSLLWSSFSYLDPGSQQWLSTSEPLGFIAAGSAGTFLVFRGSQTGPDFDADYETTLVSYTGPTDGAPAGMQVEQGFLSVFQGLGDFGQVISQALSQVNVGVGTPLYVTGHSLGSTTGTLSIPALVAAGWQPANLLAYLQASPKVGDQAFADYYASLGVTDSYCLVNSYDVVPTLPKNSAYIPVGTEATFGADYGTTHLGIFVKSVPDCHDPCCSYAYALLNPTDPYNPNMGTCMDWHNS